MSIRDWKHLPVPLTPEQMARRFAWARILRVEITQVPRAAAMVLLPHECPDTAAEQRAVVLAMMRGGWL